MTADLIGRINEALDDQNGKPSLLEPWGTLLREAAEQLAAKDAEIERLRWGVVEDVLSMPLKYRPQDVAAELRAQWGFA